MTLFLLQKVSWRLLVGFSWLAAALMLFVTQFVQPPTVVITWETASEVNTAGYYLLRSETANGDYGRISSSFIPSQGSATIGAQYRYTDHQVNTNNTYFYHLQEVELDGSTHRLSTEPIRHKPRRFSWWEAGLTAVSAIIGILFIILPTVRSRWEDSRKPKSYL